MYLGTSVIILFHVMGIPYTDEDDHAYCIWNALIALLYDNYKHTIITKYSIRK